MAPIVRMEEITRIYQMGPTQVEALKGIDLSIDEGEYVAIMGPSGSGKSTLLSLVGCLDRPTSGRYFLAGQEVSTLSDDDLARIRNRRLGFVFQSFHLLPRMSALRNVEQPLIYARVPPAERKRRATEALERVNLSHRLHHAPNELSGGERQRVAIARALVNEPALLLADEPTGNLDTATGEEILRLFDQLHQRGTTILLITHDPDVAQKAQRVLRIRDGILVGSDDPEGGS
ncbi:MAG: ABC transporter ATP-binding protein [Bacillota bacterium]|nr:ABC transporter ATP-binding protein [Bacillota bacterium]